MDLSHHAVSVFDKRAEDYQAKFMDLSLYHESFDFFCKLLKPQSELLELACGPGNITKYILEKRPDLKILATDLSPRMIELAKINNPTADVALLDVRKICNLDRKFDAILCGFGLPYLSKEDATSLILDTAKSLNPGGIFYLSTMEGDYAKSGPKKSSDGKDEIFIFFHQADYLSEALLVEGFQINMLKRQEFPEADGSKTTDLIIIAQMA